MADQKHPKMIWASSSVHADDRAPWVHLQWADKRGMLTPEEARQFALSVLEAAAAAEHDAFLVDFLTKDIGSEFAVAIAVLHDFRNRRERKPCRPVPGMQAPKTRVQ
jgi:hypothetical protein